MLWLIKPAIVLYMAGFIKLPIMDDGEKWTMKKEERFIKLLIDNGRMAVAKFAKGSPPKTWKTRYSALPPVSCVRYHPISV